MKCSSSNPIHLYALREEVRGSVVVEVETRALEASEVWKGNRVCYLWRTLSKWSKW